MGRLKSVCFEMEKEKHLRVLIEWVNDQFMKNDVLKFAQVYDYAYRVLGYKDLKQTEISRALRLLPQYQMNSTQQRKRLRGERHRPIVVNSLGNLHADLGFYSVTREYETPVTYRSGFLVAKDILSRYIYVSILKGDKSAKSLEKAFDDILSQYRKVNNGEHVSSVAFDKETSVMGHKMQAFFKKKKIGFHAFQNTASKSKMAENAIKQIKHTVAVMIANPFQTEIRWWRLIQPVVAILNSQPIQINKQFITYPDQKVATFYAPKDVNSSNVLDFVSKVQKAVPAYYFNQFDVDPRQVQFKYNVGDFVRAKLIITSSAVLGVKRSEVTLNKEIFIIEKQLPYVSKALTVEKAYVCKSLITDNIEVFDEDDVAEAPRQ